MISTEQLLKQALDLPEPDRLVLATRLLESLPPENDEAVLDDPELIAELDRRFGDLEGLVPADNLWSTE
jgi:hypothetical protein